MPIETPTNRAQATDAQRDEALIRAALPDDARALAELVVRTWRAAYRDLLPAALLDGLDAASTEARWRARLADASSWTLVCEQRGRLVGFVTCGAGRDEGESAWEGEIHALYVTPELWGRGHGHALMHAALQRLGAEGRREVLLWMLRGNQRAQRFYERQGFALDGGARQVVHSSGTTLDEVRLRRALAPTCVDRLTNRRSE